MHEQQTRDPLETLLQAGPQWRAACADVRNEAPAVREELREELARAASLERHREVSLKLQELVDDGSRAVASLRSLVDEVNALERDWVAAHRYTPEGLAGLERELRARLERDEVGGARSWLLELLDAADAGEPEAAAAIAAARLPWPEGMRAGAVRLAEAIDQWREGREGPGLETVEELANGGAPGWQAVLTDELQSRAHRYAAWAALRVHGDLELARTHIQEAVRLYPYGGRMHAERAAFHLFVGEFEQAEDAAQLAIESAPREPLGYLVLGIWAELTGEFSGADSLYRRGLRRMPAAAVARIHRRAGLIDPPGRMLMAAARLLLEAKRAREALTLLNKALLSGIRGLEAHPEAEAFQLRRRALEALPDFSRAEAAEAATQAGRLCIWNGDVDCAIEELEHAIELDSTDEAGWLLADALLTQSYPLGAATPDHDLVARARSQWDGWAEQTGLPSGSTSWAYVTRAIICDLQSQQPGAERRAGLFEALLYVEKALIHNHTDAQRWGYLAQLHRYLGLEQLAFEAVEQGYRMAAADRQVLAERLPLLAARREFEEADALAEQMVAMFGEDPWTSAVRAWVAIHHRRDWRRALELLRLPLAEGNDPAWYREMEAHAYVGLDRVDKAHEAFRQLLAAPPTDGNTKCRLAAAALAVDEPVEARRWLAAAQEDPTTPIVAYAMTAALAAIARDDVGTASTVLQNAMPRLTSITEVDDRLFEMGLAMRALNRGEAWASEREHRLRAALDASLKEHRARLERSPATADSELEGALEELPTDPLDVTTTALMAEAARRHVTAGQTARALECYERLQGSALEPEATLVLDRARAGRGRPLDRSIRVQD